MLKKIREAFSKEKPKQNQTVDTTAKQPVSVETIVNNDMPIFWIEQDFVSKSKNVFDSDHEVEAGKYILIVDDSLVVRKKIVNILKSSGLLDKHEIGIIECVNGAEALTCIRANVQYVKILLTDIEMPKMTGIELIKGIDEEIKKRLPILVISSFIDENLHILNEISINGFLNKPFSDNILLLQIEYLINKFKI